MISLRPYQERAVNDVRESFRAGYRRTLLVLPTGGGKTVCFSYISAGVARSKKRVLIIAHRRELLKQISKTLKQFNIHHSILDASARGIPRTAVTVASVFTLASRLKHFPPPDLIIGDEAHHFTPDSTWGKVVSAFPKALVLGVTATPERADGKGLGLMFDNMVIGPTVAELTAMGFLSPAEVYAPPAPDLSRLKVRAGDYAVGELEKLMGESSVTGDAVRHYLELCNGQKAVAFCVSVKHAEQVAASFCASGVPSASIDGGMETAKRDGILRDFVEGKIKVLTSCDLINEGFDCLDSETEILTPQGWKGYYDLEKGQDCYSFNTETMRMEITPIIAKGIRPARPGEKVWRVQSQHMDIRVTEGHSVFYRTCNHNYPDGMSPDIRKATARQIHEKRSPFKIPISAEAEFPGVDLTDDELRLIAWYLTDGCVQNRSLTISQAKPHGIAEIKRVIESIGLDYTVRTRVIKTGYKPGTTASEFFIPLGTRRGERFARKGWKYLEKYITKSVSKELHNMTREQFLVFWSSLLDGDGSRQGNRSGTLTCARKEQVDAYMQMAVTRGFAVMHGSYVSKNGTKIYTLRVRDAKWHSLAPKDMRGARFSMEEPSPEDLFWCVENSNGTLVTRRNGKIAILGNCPAIEVAILLRPTKSLGLYIQQLGRAIRTYPGKTGTIILDHANNTRVHGFIDDERDWQLTTETARKKKPKEEEAESVRTCPKCFAAHKPEPVCPKCGHVYEIKARQVKQVDGTLEKLERGEKRERGPVDWQRQYYALKKQAERRGINKPGEWALNIVMSNEAKRLAGKRDVFGQPMINGLTASERSRIKEAIGRG